jgi:hypothetical protein
MRSETFILEKHMFDHDKDIYYCAYCGQIATKNSSWDDYEQEIWYSCDCPTAILEYQLKNDIFQFNKNIRSCEEQLKNLPIEQKVKDIKFKYEMKQLKKIYNQK